MEKPYIYIEYPKSLYHADGASLVVENAEQESDAVDMGWMTAEQYHNPERVAEQKAAHEELARIVREQEEAVAAEQKKQEDEMAERKRIHEENVAKAKLEQEANDSPGSDHEGA